MITPIEAARYKDRAAKFLNNHQPFELVDAVVKALEPLVIETGKGPLKAVRQLKAGGSQGRRFALPARILLQACTCAVDAQPGKRQDGRGLCPGYAARLSAGATDPSRTSMIALPIAAHGSHRLG